MRKIATLITTILLITGCSRNNQQYNVTPFDTNEFADMLPKVELFTINPTMDTTITSTNGTKLEIMANSLCDDSSNLLGETVYISLQEFRNVYDLLLGKLTTVSDNNLISSDGMFFISFEQKNGKRVQLSKGKKIRLFASKKDHFNNEYYTFYADTTDKKKLNWKKGEKVEVPFLWDTLPKAELYKKMMNVITLSGFGWINCDKFRNDNNKTEVLVEVANPQNEITYCSIILQNSMSIISNIYSGDKLRFSPLPNGENAIVVCYNKEDDNTYYYSVNEIVIKPDFTLKAELTKCSKDELVNKLKSIENIHKPFAQHVL